MLLALAGLFISSMSLLILQSTMGGLQNKLMLRSKAATGHGKIVVKNYSESKARSLLKKLPVKAFLEYEIELLLKHGPYLSPVIVHGVGDGERPSFIGSEKLADIILPIDISTKLNLDEGDQIQLISPAHLNSLFGDIPRIVMGDIQKIIVTDVPEVDLYHLWVRIGMVQTLVRKRAVNRITIIEDFEVDEIGKFLDETSYVVTWEEMNQTLVYALRLETTVMVFLFIAMTMLVSLCITSGLMIFFDKIKGDLASFWILGAARKKLERASFAFFSLLSAVAVMLGIGVGFLILFLMDYFGPQIMPAVFIDRKIPVYITTHGVLISILVPYLISLLFSLLSYGQLKKEERYLNYVRSVG